MLHNYQYKFLSISRYRYLRLVIPLCSICTFFFSLLSNKCYAAINPTASLSVSNPTLSATVAPGDTAYLSSNVTYSASDIDSYTLQVSYANGYSSLKLDGGSVTLSGANGTTGSSLANNSWGFAWTNNTANNISTNAGLTYYTVPSYGTSGSGLSTGRLENVTLPESANNTLSSTTKRIVFAAKFAENNNNSGHYKTGVQLSMVATPRKAVDLSDITFMQEMKPELCSKTPFLSGETYSNAYTLKDTRDTNSYTVRKFADNRCWMTENLRIYNRTINAADSDFTSGSITLPNSSMSDFANNDTSKYSYRSYLSTASEADAGVSGYYNWYTATAGAGNSSVTADNQNTASSICPKGWTLPMGGSDKYANNFYLLFAYSGISTGNVSSTKIQGSPYNFKYTGVIYSGSLNRGDSRGEWWSSTVGDVTYAYALDVMSDHIYYSELSGTRINGRAIRCIARN